VKPRNKRSMANNTEVVHSATRAVHIATNSNYNTSVPDGPTFTTEEYNQIIAMLRNGNGGFSEGHRWHKKNVKSRNKRSMANNTKVVHYATRAVHTATNSKYNTSVPDGPTFTTEEYNQIIAMLRNSNGHPPINATCISPKYNAAKTGSHSTICWIIDSGATDHILHSSPTHNIINAQHASVGLPNWRLIKIRNIGSIKLSHELSLDKVLYILTLYIIW